MTGAASVTDLAGTFPEHADATRSSLDAVSPHDFIRCAVEPLPGTPELWHRHSAFELHLLTGGAGLAFVGDWIGSFQPGQVLLTGPYLLHGWLPLEGSTASSDGSHRVISFALEPLSGAARSIPELAELSPLFLRARRGVEFHGWSERLRFHHERISQRCGLRRLGAFCDLMGELGASTDYRLLSELPARGSGDAGALQRTAAALVMPLDRLMQLPSAGDCAAELGMSESRFSREFQRLTGRTFTDFSNRVRIERACHWLLHTKMPISQVAREVGFQSVGGFTRRFVDFKGKAPRDFRAVAAKVNS